MADTNNGKSGNKLTNKEYTKELRRLQAELCKLQEWVKYKGLRVIVIFEGRDAAGKGGTIALSPSGQPSRLPRCGVACSIRPRKEPDVPTARCRAFPSGGES